MFDRPFAPIAASLALAVAAFVIAACDRVDNKPPGTASSSEDALRADLEACREQHRIQASALEVSALRDRLRAVEAAVAGTRRRREVMLRAMDEYARGVALIHGVFTFVDVTRAGPRRLTAPDGKSLALETLGSGFLVSRHGHLATNRHVVEPWRGNESVAPLLRRGLQPEFVSLSVTFPGRDGVPVDRDTIRVSATGLDLAVLRVDVQDVPVLPLSVRDPTEFRGQDLMLLGYPTGLSALLARLEPEVADSLMAGATDTESLIRALNAVGGLLPVSTHGTLNHVTPHRLVYDAATTSGGSGGPAFGPDGEVIGVNFAVLRGFAGSNFGVPIRYLEALTR